jgi:hypothetical protein
VNKLLVAPVIGIFFVVGCSGTTQAPRAANTVTVTATPTVTQGASPTRAVSSATVSEPVSSPPGTPSLVLCSSIPRPSACPTPYVAPTVTALSSPVRNRVLIDIHWGTFDTASNSWTGGGCLDHSTTPEGLPRDTDRFELRLPGSGQAGTTVAGVTTGGWGVEQNCAINAEVVLDPEPSPPIVTVVDARTLMYWGPFDLRSYETDPALGGVDGWVLDLTVK